MSPSGLSILRARRLLPALTLVVISVCSRSVATAEPWVDQRVIGPFLCRADFSLREHDGVFRDLFNIQQDLSQRLGLPPAREMIEIRLFRDRTTYNQHLNKWFPNVPYRRALYVKNKGPGIVMAYHSEQLYVDMRHECTHALLHAVLPMVPLWLDEGLAEYYEVPVDQRIARNPHHKSSRWKARLGQLPPLNRLEAKSSLAEMGRVEYRQAWAWTHFLLHGPPQAQRELTSFFRDIQDGAPPGQLSERLDRAFRDPRRELAAHFKSFRG